MSEPRELALIVAVASNGVIGRDGGLPWHVPEDLKRFKALTLGHPVVMGRRTHESIGRALPGRRNLVVTSGPLEVEGVEVFTSLDQALESAWRTDARPFVIGGARLYAAALPRATHLFITRIEREVPGDVVFPEVDWSRWEEVARVPAVTEGVTFVDYRLGATRHP